MTETISAPIPAKFLAGSTMKHLVVMTSSNAAGLLAIFAVDFINIFYLNQLGQVEVSAAAGYATTLFFFLISFGIGMAISAAALVSPALGQGDHGAASRLSRNLLIFTGASTFAFALGASLFASDLAGLLGATGKTQELTASYMRIVLPSTPFLTAAMVCAAILRSVGDARRSMSVTLSGALVTALLDPVFIFMFDWDLEGAAVASSLSRIVSFLLGFCAVAKVYKLISIRNNTRFWPDVPKIMAFAIPAVLTNLATPFSNAFVTQALASFGDDAVAGWTIISRLFPIAFVGVFALSGSLGPVLGQNLGAGLLNRVRSTYTNSLIFMVVYTACAWVMLALSYQKINLVLKAPEGAGQLVAFFCLWLVPLFVFTGALFVSNAALNNLGRPRLPAYINWLRATLGTIPFVFVGARIAGTEGILTGHLLGAVVFGVLGVHLCYRFIEKSASSSTRDTSA